MLIIIIIILNFVAEDEGSRIKGRRMTLSDINGNGLKWRPFNGSWINGNLHICILLFSFAGNTFIAIQKNFRRRIGVPRSNRRVVHTECAKLDSSHVDDKYHICKFIHFHLILYA